MKTYNTPADIWQRFRTLSAALNETTLTPDRRPWFENLCNEFRQLVIIANAYTFPSWQSESIAATADDFNEAQLFYMGATIAAPSLHYSYTN